MTPGSQYCPRKSSVPYRVQWDVSQILWLLANPSTAHGIGKSGCETITVCVITATTNHRNVAPLGKESRKAMNRYLVFFFFSSHYTRPTNEARGIAHSIGPTALILVHLQTNKNRQLPGENHSYGSCPWANSRYALLLPTNASGTMLADDPPVRTHSKR